MAGRPLTVPGDFSSAAFWLVAAAALPGSSLEIEDVGLNPTDLGSLCLLLLHGPAPAGRLAELTGLTTGAVTGVIDRLEAGGFVRRELDPADRRRVIVVPDRGRVDRDLFPHFPSLQRAAAAKFYDTYSDAELEVISAFLSRLTSPEP